MEFVNDKKGLVPCGPYSHAVRSGNMLYVSGQIPFDPISGALVGANIEEQTAQTMKNLVSLLDTVDIGLKNVVKITAYLADWDDFSSFNNVYAKYMGDHKPARATVEVSRIAGGALLELDAIVEFS
ncbi:MAG: Rid family detoxifying hydrolase [Desulfovibrio sp.]|nr:Rid family detoxifying hydrolase [Desulfovibrio sp.]